MRNEKDILSSTGVRNPEVRQNEPVGVWDHPALIQPNNFVYKSLSNWALNFFVGCDHACRFCYVPSAATIKQGAALRQHGVQDPDLEWGEYVLVRTWHEPKFLASLRRAENTPRSELAPDGNRAVMLCTTTDPYQVIKHPDPTRAAELRTHATAIVRRALELIRDHSSLNVRILTRSPLARRDFDLFRSFGNRLMFGMSLPTLRHDLARIYEPKAPAPARRLEMLRAAAESGIPVFVALAPTPPEVDEADLKATLAEVATLRPQTVFHEPINIRADNVARIQAHAARLGVQLDSGVFDSADQWRAYAIGQLQAVEGIATQVGLADRLHLWPDKSLGSRAALATAPDPHARESWLRHWWTRVSEWPGQPAEATA
jgi:DNA repair photolyase